MANVYDIAAAAKRLKDDDTFKDVVEAVKEAQIRAFLDPHSDKEMREEAHVIIRALSKIEDIIDAQIADGDFQAKKDQHRAND